MQGSRQDAVPINMTSPVTMTEHGFDFTFADRTRGRRRSGEGVFRAPYVLQYNAAYELSEEQQQAGEDPNLFNLTALCIPTKPGWSRTIIYGAPPAVKGKNAVAEPTAKGKNAVAAVATKKKPKTKVPLLFKIIRILPVWLLHQLSNTFLDSDLVFLHVQEQERNKRGVDLDGYFMPAQVSRWNRK